MMQGKSIPTGSSSQALIGEGGYSTKFMRRRRKKGVGIAKQTNTKSREPLQDGLVSIDNTTMKKRLSNDLSVALIEKRAAESKLQPMCDGSLLLKGCGCIEDKLWADMKKWIFDPYIRLASYLERTTFETENRIFGHKCANSSQNDGARR